MNSVIQSEVQKFSKDSDHWWDENGPFAPLHRLNPARLSYIKRQICDHYKRDYDRLKALDGLCILDIGCGGGLVCEPLARMGAGVTGVDADSNAIAVATDHAKSSSLDITYKNQSAEALRDQYDVVLALEIIEHVADPAVFVENCTRLVKPGGLLILSTLNRTAKSYAMGIVAAEYILGWVPQGTHDWKKFVKPSEMRRYLNNAGCEAFDICGLIYNPLKNDFQLHKSDIDVNYLMSGRKP